MKIHKPPRSFIFSTITSSMAMQDTVPAYSYRKASMGRRLDARQAG